MSSPAERLSTLHQVALRIMSVTDHVIRRFEGDPHELLDRMRTEHRTGICMIYLNQGTVTKLEFDSRLRKED